MTKRQITRATLGVVVLGSLMVLPLFAHLNNLTAGVQAPLYALITAMGLSLVLGARAKYIWDRIFNWTVGVVAIVAVALSAFQWLVSEDAGIVIEMIGAFGALLAGIAFMVNLDGFDTTQSGTRTITMTNPTDGRRP